MRRVYSGEERFIVEKDSLPVAAFLSIAEYEELMRERQAREERLSQFRQAVRAVGEAFEQRGLSEEDVLAELERQREQMYRERYGNSGVSGPSSAPDVCQYLQID